MHDLLRLTRAGIRAGGYRTEVGPYTLAHVGWGNTPVQHGPVDGVTCIYVRGDDGSIIATVTIEQAIDRSDGKFLNLGWGLRHRLHGKRGIRRALWDAAFGYVNGWPLRDIVYYLWTRSLSNRQWGLIEVTEPSE